MVFAHGVQSRRCWDPPQARTDFRCIAGEFDAVNAQDPLRTRQYLGDYAGVRTALQSQDAPRKAK
eukprot:7088044-Alexandrium_andersonii.AAC.1